MIPFNRPTLVGAEFTYIRDALDAGHLAGNGGFTKRCQAELERRCSVGKALLTHSCTAALEMCALLAEVGPGDEVIMPSFTFVSTANAFVLRGATPVFVDVSGDTFNLDAASVEAAITPRTRAIVAVHYAGVACDMRALLEIASRHDLLLVEDAAQALGSTYRDHPLGSFGALAALSFHETKNIIAGEGGALLLRDDRFWARADILWEKGTNRASYFRGEVDKYTWVDVGSSFLPSEVTAAFLYAQLEQVDAVTARRRASWNRYHEALADLEQSERIRRPIVPAWCGHNGHMYYILLPSLTSRTAFIAVLREAGIGAVFHYVPLHTSPAGMRYGRAHGSMAHSVYAGDHLVRLPLWPGIESQLDDVIARVREAIIRSCG